MSPPRWAAPRRGAGTPRLHSLSSVLVAAQRHDRRQSAPIPRPGIQAQPPSQPARPGKPHRRNVLRLQRSRLPDHNGRADNPQESNRATLPPTEKDRRRRPRRTQKPNSPVPDPACILRETAVSLWVAFHSQPTVFSLGPGFLSVLSSSVCSTGRPSVCHSTAPITAEFGHEPYIPLPLCPLERFVLAVFISFQ